MKLSASWPSKHLRIHFCYIYVLDFTYVLLCCDHTCKSKLPVFVLCCYVSRLCYNHSFCFCSKPPAPTFTPTLPPLTQRVEQVNVSKAPYTPLLLDVTNKANSRK